ncbi:MAG: acyl-CoA dehydrogenase family protein [Dehalococcoidia bacterium]
MDFGLTEIQEMIRANARDFLAEYAKPESLREALEDPGIPIADSDYWSRVSELGWPGLAIPEQYGGAGMSFADLAVLLEEWGAALAPGPLFETAVIGTAVIEEFGSDDQKRNLLPRMAAGELIATLAFHEEHAAWDPSVINMRGTQQRRGWQLNGHKRFVPHADTAHVLITAARTGPEPHDLTLFLVSNEYAPGAPEQGETEGSGITFAPMHSASGRPIFAVDFHDVELWEDAVLGRQKNGGELIGTILQRAAAGRAVQMAGAAQRVLDMTVEYVSNRRQFGRAVGSFQAVQHHCAEMAIAARSTRHMAYSAAWRISEGMPAAREVAQAKIAANDALLKVCRLSHQCHGAIGFTWEHDLHLYTRSALEWRADYGNTEDHRGVLANELLL